MGTASEIGVRSFMGRRTRRSLLRAALFFVDVLAVASATLLATQIRWGSLRAEAVVQGSHTGVPYLFLGAIVAATWLVLFWWERLYDLDRLFWGTGEYTRVLTSVTLGMVAFILATYILKLEGFARGWILLAWLLGFILVAMARLLVRSMVFRARRHGRLLRPTVIVGSNREARDIAARLTKDRSSGLALVGYLTCADRGGELDELDGRLECLGGVADLECVVREREMDSVVIAISAFSHESAARMIAALRLLDVDVNLSAGLLDVTTRRILVREASGVPLILVKGVSFSPANLFVKRTFDLLIASIAVVVGLPVWLVLAASVKLSSPGPVFFKQARTGRGGREFAMLKFRSMRADAQELHAKLAAESNEADGPIFKMKDDPRVTPVGRFMRRFSLDEVPQLVNVLRGEMSLVGPRPLPTYETKNLTPEQNRRHEVPPGLTGMWQVSGRSGLTFDEMVQLDLFYIENWSVPLDLAMLARTIPAVFSTDGAY